MPRTLGSFFIATVVAATLAACNHSPTSPSCTYALTAPSSAFDATGGGGSLGVNTAARCAWTVRTGADWITLVGATSGSGPATIAFTVAGNPASADRSTTLAVADQSVTIRQIGRACDFSVTPEHASHPAQGGRGTVNVNTTPGCQWTAASESSWLRIVSGEGGLGPGIVTYEAAANDTTESRDGALAIAGQRVTIHQDARSSCTFRISPESETFDAAGSTGGFDVTTAPDCEWTVQTDASWIHITTPAGRSAKGPGPVLFVVDPQTAADSRSATIVAGDATFRATQRGATTFCDYSVSPLAFSYHWHGTDGQTAEIQISTGGSCTWTASSDVAWLSIRSGASGTGSGRVGFGVASYTDLAPRRAPIMVRWPTATAGQNVWITQEGCGYALGATSRAFGPEGGRGQVTVIASPMSVDCMIGCPWTATTQASWIHITTAMPHAGDDELFFNVDPNTTGADRTGTIVMRDLTLTITQGR